MNKELRALKRENRKLRKQNEYLTHRIDMLSGAKQGGAQAPAKRLGLLGIQSAQDKEHRRICDI